MYICYIDESGHCGDRLNPEEPYEVLCGVLIDLTKLSKSQREYDLRLRTLRVPELKASDAYRGRKDWYAVPAAERDLLFDDLLAWASERRCKFIASPIDCRKFFTRKAENCEYSNRFGAPWQTGAFHILLALQRLQVGKPGNKGRTIVVIDEQKSHDVALLNLLSQDLSYTDGFTEFSPPRKGWAERFDQIIDVPHFSKSQLTILIQIADWAAFILNKALLLRVAEQPEKYQGEGMKIERWYRGIEHIGVSSSSIDPPRSTDPFSKYLRTDIRPDRWQARSWP